jgi:5-methylcytosine-specific restriction endonuclease McrA
MSTTKPPKSNAKPKIDITAKELAEALDISEKRLLEICDFFDQDPDDDWELIEGFHFVWGAYGARIFSPEGATEICNYLEQNSSERPFFTRFTRWILRRDQKLKGLMVAKRIQAASESNGQVIFVNSRAFLAPRACREILGLGKRQDILKRTFSEIQRSEDVEIEPLQINVDFFVNENEDRYFSGSGLASIGKRLESRLTQKHRKEWAKVVAEYAPKALASLEKHEQEKEVRIQRAMTAVRNKANKRCQVTGVPQSIGQFDLEVHHIFDRKHYPQLADVEMNLIAISGPLHLNFHKSMGGTQVSCTIDDFIAYIEANKASLLKDADIDHVMKLEKRLSTAKKVLEALLD